MLTTRLCFCLPTPRRSARFFFFSSRRRHTRWPRDWSSDVCSSDLRQRWFELIWDPDEQRFGVPAFIAVPDSVDALDSHVQDARDRFDKGEPGLLVIAEAHDPDRFLGN